MSKFLNLFCLVWVLERCNQFRSSERESLSFFVGGDFVCVCVIAYFFSSVLISFWDDGYPSLVVSRPPHSLALSHSHSLSLFCQRIWLRSCLFSAQTETEFPTQILSSLLLHFYSSLSLFLSLDGEREKKKETQLRSARTRECDQAVTRQMEAVARRKWSDNGVEKSRHFLL